MHPESDWLPISALQHLIFCERQWALMYLEGQWEENLLTAAGKVLHDRAHHDGDSWQDGIRIVRGLRLCSAAHGLTGIADVIEFHPATAEEIELGTACAVPVLDGLWRPFPVEYKRGKPKPDDSDRVQLCAQAMCLEEMLQVSVPAGALYYGRPRKRTAVDFDKGLRETTAATAQLAHELIVRGITPRPAYQKKCRSCSLLDRCRPKAIGHCTSVEKYIQAALSDALERFDQEDERQ